jgi:hypothetical protein
MSSCSEYLVRQQLRIPKYIDTRPKMTCGQAIEIQRQTAAAAVYETFLPATACVSTLNAPSTRTASSATIARGHRVKDASQYITYASANATAVMQNPKNAKPVNARGVSQILNENCLAGKVVASQNSVASAAFVEQLPELQDKITLSTLLPTTDPNYRKEDIIMAARQALGPNCCPTCGRLNWHVYGKVNFASTCTACKGVNAGDTNADGTRKFKSAYVFPTAIS